LLVVGAKYSPTQLRHTKTRQERLENLLDKAVEWGKVEWWKVTATGRGLKGWKVRLKITERKAVEPVPPVDPATQDTGNTPADTGATKQAELIAHVFEYAQNRNLDGAPVDWPAEEKQALVRSVQTNCPQFGNTKYNPVMVQVLKLTGRDLAEERERREPGE
jgi:hypothetical protein